MSGERVTVCRCEEPTGYPHACPCLPLLITSREVWLVATGQPLVINGRSIPYRREATLQAWGAGGSTVPQQVNRDLTCRHRGEYLETVACHTCNGRVTAPVFDCELLPGRRCTMERRAVDDSIAWCRLCAEVTP